MRFGAVLPYISIGVRQSKTHFSSLKHEHSPHTGIGHQLRQHDCVVTDIRPTIEERRREQNFTFLSFLPSMSKQFKKKNYVCRRVNLLLPKKKRGRQLQERAEDELKKRLREQKEFLF